MERPLGASRLGASYTRAGIAVAEAAHASLPDPPRRRAAADRLALAGVVALLAGAALLRWWACQSELWLDEVWSLDLVRQLESPLGVLTALHHDNNHHLNSWYLQAIGEPRAFWAFRLHSFAAGLGVVVLGCLWLRPRGRAGLLLAALLLGSSNLLIHYASEARGYSLMLLFGLASLLVTRRFLARPGAGGALLYALCALGGFLSHLSFLHVFAGIAAWTALALARETPRAAAVGRWLGYQALPALTLAGLWWLDLRLLVVGGGPEPDLPAILIATLSYVVGGPAAGAGALLAAGASALACAISLGAIWREGRSEWVAFAVAAFASPALLLWGTDPEVVFVRYFLVSVTLALLLLAELGARLAGRGRVAAGAVATVALAIAAANGAHTATLLRDGRGGLQQALRGIAASASGSRIRLGATQERLAATMLRFYARYLPAEVELDYVDHASWPQRPPEWVLDSRRGPQPTAPAALEIAGHRYRLTEMYSTAPLSGHSWRVYRLDPGGP